MTVTDNVTTDQQDLTRHVAGLLADGSLYPQWSEIIAPLIVDRLAPSIQRSYRVTNDVRREVFNELPEAAAWAQVLDNMHRDVDHQIETMLHVSFDTPWKPIGQP